MKNLKIEIVEEMLEGKISKNPNRFEAANGIAFSVNNMTDEIREYFSGQGVEFHELVNGIYYTETILSTAEFGHLDHIMHIKHIA